MADPSDLATLDAVKAWLPAMATVATDDGLLASLITAASQFVASYCNRGPFLSIPYVDLADGNGRAWMLLRQWPVTAVSSLVLGEPGGHQTTIVEAEARPGFLLEPPLPAGGNQRLTLIQGVFPRGRSNVQVAYTAGYATPPPAVAQAVIELAGERYRARDRIGMASKTLGGQETTSFSQADMNATIKALLSSYRRLVPA